MFRPAIALVFAVLAIFAAGPSLAADNDSVGTVQSVQGTVEVERGGQKGALVAGTALQGDDVVSVAAGSRVRFSFVHDSVVELAGPASAKLSVLAEEAGKHGLVALFYGNLRAQVRAALGKDDSFRVQGLVATTGVRGTDFTVGASEGGDMLVQVEQGQVEVERGGDGDGDGADKAQVLRVAAGQRLEGDESDTLVPASGTVDAAQWLGARRKILPGRVRLVAGRIEKAVDRLHARLGKRGKRDAFRRLRAFTDETRVAKPFAVLTAVQRLKETVRLRQAGRELLVLKRQVRRLEIASRRLAGLAARVSADAAVKSAVTRTLDKWADLKDDLELFRAAERALAARVGEVRAWKRDQGSRDKPRDDRPRRRHR